MTDRKSIHPEPSRVEPWHVEPWHIEVVESTGSTNVDLLVRAERGELLDRTVLRTGHQTAGRGRLDRKWDAPPGTNLLFSIHFRHADEPADAMHRVGLAVIDAITTLSGSGVSTLRLGLKWPNDVLLDGRKLAGVLAQRSTSAPGLVVGAGVNVAWAPEGCATVNEVAVCDARTLLAAVLEAHDALPVDIMERYRTELLTIGQRVRVHLPGDRVVIGAAVGVDDRGGLVVDTDDGSTTTFDVGDVVHLRSE